MSGNNFNLTTNNQGFSSRLDAVFSGLAPLEQNHQKWETDHKDETQTLIKSDPVIEESISNNRRKSEPFKVPTNNYRKRNHNKLVDHQINPGKWTKYSLADVSDYEMSDKSNTKTALSFLALRKKQKLEEDAEIESPENSEKKLVFRKPVKSSQVKNDEDQMLVDPPPISTQRFLMPECVVGISKPKKNFPEKKSVDKLNPSLIGGISLNHLEVLDDDLCEDLMEPKINVDSPAIKFRKLKKK